MDPQNPQWNQNANVDAYLNNQQLFRKLNIQGFLTRKNIFKCNLFFVLILT